MFHALFAFLLTEPTWLKGQTHVHTDGSDDGDTPVAEVLDWYAAHDYDFVVITDHNVVTPLPEREDLIAIRGAELTQNPKRCDGGGKCNVHVNALFAETDTIPWVGKKPKKRLLAYQRALDAIAEMGAVAQINHPNYRWTVDEELMGELAARGAVLVEIANQVFADTNGGDEAHPTTEALWDAALTAGYDVWGVASDDAHDFAADPLTAGRHPMLGDAGWIVVRAVRDEDAIRRAIVRGDFYSSTGVALADVRVEAGELVVELMSEAEIVFIGEGGRELGRVRATTARQPLGTTGYVRAVVTDDAGRKAWTQPARPSVWVRVLGETIVSPARMVEAWIASAA